jgi:hypothetical protein
MRKKKKSQLEFRLFVYPTYNETTRKWATAFRLQTIEQFSNFTYEIVVKDTVREKTISWSIRGLQSPTVHLPGSGPASFMKEYENLKGVYEFVISKLDGAENAFTLRVASDEVAILNSPKTPFVEIIPSNET